MKKYFTILFPAGAIMFVILMASFGGSNLKSSGGAPEGYTNSPGDGQNCSHCMGGTAAPVTGWIASNIPGTGYVQGSTYTITVTATGSGNKGFQISPQDIQGNLIGTLTAGTGNKLVGNGKYVTHTSAQSSATASWNFQWTAPSSNAGDVTFYGSIAVGKLNTKTTTLTVSQSTVGIAEQTQSSFSVQPNPATDKIMVAFTNNVSGKVAIDLLDNRGNPIRHLLEETMSAGEFSRNFTIGQPAGIYFLRITTGEKAQVKKIIVR